MASKSAPAPPPAPEEAAPATATTATVVKPAKDANGNGWTVEKVRGGVYVTILTKAGRQSSVTAPTEDEARELLLNHLK